MIPKLSNILHLSEIGQAVRRVGNSRCDVTNRSMIYKVCVHIKGCTVVNWNHLKGVIPLMISSFKYQIIPWFFFEHFEISNFGASLSWFVPWVCCYFKTHNSMNALLFTAYRVMPEANMSGITRWSMQPSKHLTNCQMCYTKC